jgi:putative PEP-CTERM system histidine kinase
MEIKDLCAAVSKMIAKTLNVLSVTIWLLDENQEGLVMGGSTVFSEARFQNMDLAKKGEAELIRAMQQQLEPVDLEFGENSWAADLQRAYADYFEEARIRYCIPLIAGGNLVGLLTLDDRVAEETITLEDFDLLKTIAGQTAANLLNMQLAGRLRQMKEMEAFQTVSAFIMHDFKNLASTLSLTMQNLPMHFDNPEFRKDAVRITQQSLTKINNICAGLSSLSRKMDLKRTKIDLNELVANIFSSLNEGVKASLTQDLRPLPKLFIDPEQMRKVLINLILNANDAIGNGGEIYISTEQRDGWVILTVRDNGCGMSKEFIERSLFRPFKTTKKQGMGIGLFQSKMIIESHGGRIEVESEEGKGSTFKVMLPIDKRV